MELTLWVCPLHYCAYLIKPVSKEWIVTYYGSSHKPAGLLIGFIYQTFGQWQHSFEGTEELRQVCGSESRELELSLVDPSVT